MKISALIIVLLLFGCDDGTEKDLNSDMLSNIHLALDDAEDAASNVGTKIKDLWKTAEGIEKVSSEKADELKKGLDEIESALDVLNEFRSKFS